MKETLKLLVDGKILSREDAKSTLLKITNGDINKSQISSFLTVYMMRDITPDELLGFRDALLEKSIKVELDGSNAIDLCGTGGDGKDTFNISTITSFVVAGAGYKVIKHGNGSVSSSCGSSDVLSALGCPLTDNEELLKKQLGETNFCYLHAPLFHPALASVGPVRKELGLKTFFNIMGPLVNPVQPAYQMVGVYSLDVGNIYDSVLSTCRSNYGIVYSNDGYDEISLTSDYIITSRGNSKTYKPTYGDVGIVQPNDIFGGNTIEEATDIFEKILTCHGTKSQTEVVIINSAHAIQVINPKLTFLEAFEEAEDSLLDRKALDVLTRLKEIK